MAAVEAMFVEVLVCVTKPGKTHNQYTVAVRKNRIVKATCHKKFHAFVLFF